MILSLYIRDFALIDELEIRFGHGLNVITGETGAGKSIIVGALNILLGERAQTESIRDGATKAIAEVRLKHYDDHRLMALFGEGGIDASDEIILRREVRASGSRAFVNDTPVQLHLLRAIGALLVDLHGQHDHQLLLDEENHRLVLDDRPEIRPVLSNYADAYRQMTELKRELDGRKQKERELAEKQELHRFQLKEIKTLDLKDGEKEELEHEMRLLDSAEDLSRNAGLMIEAGRDGETNVLELIRLMEQSLSEIGRIEPEFMDYKQELRTARISIEELIQVTERYRDNIEFNPERLEHLRQRVTAINRLEKKYGKDFDGLIAYRQELEYLLNLTDNFDLETGKLEQALREAEADASEKARRLHDARMESGKRISSEIEKELLKLGFNYAVFEVHVDYLRDPSGPLEIEGAKTACLPHGCDEVRFFISTNKGEPPKPLSKTASGGEISRIMLALKSILAREQRLPVMIFDEIDIGISGPVALQVGQTMRGLSGHCQILCITHLPQIASMGHTHYVVSKSETNGRTVTGIKRLSENEHVLEVAKLMSGSAITDSTINTARELIASAPHPGQ